MNNSNEYLFFRKGLETISCRKLFSFLLTLTFVTGCAVTNVRERSETYLTFAYDLTPYFEKGFTFTLEDVDTFSNNYEPILYLDLVYRPEFKIAERRRDFRSPNFKDGYSIYKDPYKESKYWYVKNIKPSDILDKAYELAAEKNANAITSLQLVPTTIDNGSLSVSTYRLRGFAILVKD